MSEKNRYVTLNNGNKMPVLGLGTFLAEDEKELHDAIVHAVLECGYRHIDTAKVYKNEHVVGEALQDWFKQGVKREDMFITTKLWRTDFDKVEDSLKASLEKLQLEYVDLYLIHWTITEIDFDNHKVVGPPMYKVWKDMEAMVDQGLTKSIGISNANCQMFVDILAGAKIPPVVNQIEVNPYFSQKDFCKFMKDYGVYTTAYAPLGSKQFTDSNLLEDEDLKKIADKHEATTAQVVLAWSMAKDHIVIPKSTNKDRVKQNFDALDLKLDKEEIETIDNFKQGKRGFDTKFMDDPEINWKPAPLMD